MKEVESVIPRLLMKGLTHWADNEDQSPLARRQHSCTEFKLSLTQTLPTRKRISLRLLLIPNRTDSEIGAPNPSCNWRFSSAVRCSRVGSEGALNLSRAWEKVQRHVTQLVARCRPAHESIDLPQPRQSTRSCRQMKTELTSQIRTTT